MISVRPGAEPVPDGEHWATTVASLAVGAAFFTLWFWLLPPWLGFHVDSSGAARWRWIAAVPSVLGFAVALRCVWDFGLTGRGTPVPVAPPKRLVVVGFYRYVRNPMYLGFFVGWTGLWLVFGRANLATIAVACAVVLGIALFVRLYEEPTLRKMFGADYEHYCRNVRRWLPRTHPWHLKVGFDRNPISAFQKNLAFNCSCLTPARLIGFGIRVHREDLLVTQHPQTGRILAPQQTAKNFKIEKRGKMPADRSFQEIDRDVEHLESANERSS